MATPTICLTVNAGGGYSGTFTLAANVYIITLAPRATVPGGYVLTITDTTTGISVSYLASVNSTCDALIFANIATIIGPVTITIANNALCCSSQSSSASPIGQTNNCCPGVIVPNTLYATFGNPDGTCTAIALNNASVPLINSGAFWLGTLKTPPYEWDISLTCEFISAHWAWTITVTCAPKVEAIIVSCNPFLLAFRLNMSGADGPCCNGHIIVNVSP